ncbi:hypothetical protein GCM10010140_44010 [Streptosporangium pseudovulgare]|uniref:Uncharacterized protein n=1 Tax=Streptosporangium pseudovulgare TaxID=35765 RepID=A0ABQ2R1Q5_9ACTN|nr:hypothetical protein GCM10010140_44010 [Streptosporangium pseudovulgare]
MVTWPIGTGLIVCAVSPKPVARTSMTADSRVEATLVWSGMGYLLDRGCGEVAVRWWACSRAADLRRRAFALCAQAGYSMAARRMPDSAIAGRPSVMAPPF